MKYWEVFYAERQNRSQTNKQNLLGIPCFVSLIVTAAALGVAEAPGDASLTARWVCPASTSPSPAAPVPNAAVAVVAGSAAPCGGGGGSCGAAWFCLLKDGWVASRNGSREMTVVVAISFPKAMARRASICWIACMMLRSCACAV